MSNAMCEKVLCEALCDEMKLERLIHWLNDKNFEAPLCGLVEENEIITQYKFTIWFLNYIRLKASLMINDKRPKNAGSSTVVSNSRSQKVEFQKKLPVTDKDTKCNTSRSNDDYLKEFPSLQGSLLDKCSKSHKRIKPTSIKNEDLSLNEKQLVKNNCASQSSSLSCSLNVRNEELLSQRFLGQKVQKPRFSPFQVEIIYKDKNNCTPVNCSDTKLNKLIDLYNNMLINYLVPNITGEIKFILNIYDSLTEYNFCGVPSEKQCENNASEISILNSENEWGYFCTKIILNQEYLISKLDCNVLKFLVHRMSLFNVEIPASYSKINQDIVINQSVCAFHDRLFTILRLSANDFTDEDDFVFCCNLRKTFLEMEKKWCTNRSEKSLIEDIKCILNLCTLTTHFYFLGQLFVFCLVKTIEGSIINNSNSEQKMAQLNTRLRKPFQHSDLEPDITFQSNELFFKLWLDYCLHNCPMVIHYVQYWIIYAILTLINEVYKDLGDSLYSNVRSKLLWTLKIKITLAKFLGFIKFYFYRHNYKLVHSEKQQLIRVLSEVLPNFDLKRCLIEAIKNGILVLTIPWIIEFFCMADAISTSIPYYQDILLTLMSFYLSSHVRYDKDVQKGTYVKKDLFKTTMLIPHRSFNDLRVEGVSVILNKSSLVFLLIWIGKLFDSKAFGESLFLEIAHIYKEKKTQTKFKSGNHWKSSIDCAEFVKRDVFMFCCSHFSKMKYWENSSRSYIKNIRPISLDSEQNTASLIDIQDQLEATFLTDNQSLDTLINFVTERLSNICQHQISKIVTAETNDLQVADEVEEEMVQSSVASNQLHPQKKELSNTKNLLGTMIPKVLEVIKNCEQKIEDSLTCLSPPDLPAPMLQACNKIASKKLKRRTKDWLINEGFCLEEIEKCLIATDGIIQEDVVDSTKEDTESLSPCITSVSSSFLSIHKFMREINTEKSTFQNFNFIFKKFWELSTQLQEMNEPKILKDLYVVSWDCVFLIVTHHHEVLSSSFFSEIVNFWEKNHFGDNEERILCTRIIKAASLSSEEAQRTSAINLALLITHNLDKKMITPSHIENQTWDVFYNVCSKNELQFFKLLLTTLYDLLKSDSASSTPELLSHIESFIDMVNSHSNKS